MGTAIDASGFDMGKEETGRFNVESSCNQFVTKTFCETNSQQPLLRILRLESFNQTQYGDMSPCPKAQKEISNGTGRIQIIKGDPDR